VKNIVAFTCRIPRNARHVTPFCSAACNEPTNEGKEQKKQEKKETKVRRQENLQHMLQRIVILADPGVITIQRACRPPECIKFKTVMGKKRIELIP